MTHLNAIARRYAWSLPLVACLSVIGTAFEGAGVTLIIPLLMTMLDTEPTGAQAPFAGLLGPLPDEFGVGVIIAAILGFIIVRNVLQVFNLSFMARIEGRFGHDVRCALSQRLLEVGYPFFLEEKPGRIVNAVTTETWRTSAGYRQIMAGTAAAAALVVFGVLVLMLDWRLSVIVLAGTLLIRMVENRLIRRSSRLSHAVTGVNDRLAERMLHTVLAMRMLRIFGREKYEQRRFSDASEDVRRAVLDVELSTAIVSPMLEVLHIALLMIVLLVAMISGSVALPVLAAFLVLLQRAQPHLRELESARSQFAAARGAFAEMDWLLDPSGKPARPPGTHAISGIARAIEFRDVKFEYAGRGGAAAALGGVSFTIRAGGATALLGPSGSGKSTVINLLCRFIAPTSGTILVDGVDLGTLDVAQWRALIGLAGQDVDLIDGTIADNIAYGAPDCTREAIIEAASRADAQSFIEALPQGYETRVGSRGLNLSGGQRQRIGLARAFVRQPKLLILDEATNEIDAMSEHAILSLLRDHPRDMTVCVISHRPGTLAMCDYGIEFEQGRVADAGPLASMTAYQRMLRGQT